MLAGSAVSMVAVVLAGAPGVLGPAQAGSADPAGLWSGPIEHNGQSSRFALRLERRAGGGFDARVSMPAIGAYDVAVGTAALVGGEVRIGGWTGRFDPDAGTLSGLVPRGLLPVYDVPFTLTRTDALEPPKRREPAPATVPRWAVEVDGPVWAGVAASGGVVYAATDAGTLYALREDDGARIWSFGAGGPLRATPTIDGGAIYLQSDDGRAHRLDAATGTPRWDVGIGAAAERIPPGQDGSRYDSYGSSLLLAGGSAFAGTYEGGVVALDPETGEERWRCDEESSVLGSPTWSRGRIFYGTFDGSLVARDPGTGEEVWRIPSGGAIVSSPSPAGDLLVIGTRSYDVLGVRADDGAVVWTYYYWFSWVESTAALRDGIAYLGSSDGQRLQALDAASGKPVWDFPTEGSTWATPAVSADRVYVGTVGIADYMVDHQARFHAVDRRSGEAAWRFAMERPPGAATWGFASSPAVGAQGVYVGGLDGRVYAFGLRTEPGLGR